jgi:CspA family cold shock protein
MENKRYTGKIAWFDPKKGYGFIIRDDGGKDIFVHYSDIEVEGFKVLMSDDLVEFEETNTFKNKLKAAKVTLVSRKSK